MQVCRKRKLETGGNMENKVIAKEYVDKNYVHKDKIREKIKWLDMQELRGKYYFENVKLAYDILEELLEDKQMRGFNIPRKDTS